jgi:hypothetical protein
MMPFIAPVAEDEISDADIEKSELGVDIPPPPISIFGRTSVTVSVIATVGFAKAGAAAELALSATVTIVMCLRF